jgi:chitinase
VDFSITARTAVTLPAGRYRFTVTSDDGVRLGVDGHRVIDAWSVHLARRDTAEVALAAGEHELKVEYFQAGGPYKLWVRIEPLERQSQ